MSIYGRLAILCAALAIASPAAAGEADRWLEELYGELAADVADGQPLVVQVHVPLCDRNVIRCGNERLGDGDNPDTNLYWSTSGGFKGWFRKAAGWKLVHTDTPARGPVVETRVWRKSLSPTARWRALGVKRRFDVYVVASAWRGSATARAIDQYVADLYGDDARALELAGGQTLRTGGAAHLVAYVGHNGWMDIPPYDWEAAGKRRGQRRKATIAVACMTADYLAEPISDRRRVPLLMTTGLLFAGAHSFEGAVSAFARGEGLAAIRRAASENYARGQGKPYRRVRGNFTNPSDKRWQRYVPSR